MLKTKKQIGKIINSWFPLGHKFSTVSDRERMKKEIYIIIDKHQTEKTSK